jgi:DNA-binding CsgD family transcriptional regulator
MFRSDGIGMIAHERADVSPKRSRCSQRRTRVGWDSLTTAELRVAALVEEGLTYRDIADRLGISKRTVESHVAHALRKLGGSNRRELADEVRRRETTRPPIRARSEGTR